MWSNLPPAPCTEDLKCKFYSGCFLGWWDRDFKGWLMKFGKKKTNSECLPAAEMGFGGTGAAPAPRKKDRDTLNPKGTGKFRICANSEAAGIFSSEKIAGLSLIFPPESLNSLENKKSRLQPNAQGCDHHRSATTSLWKTQPKPKIK